jgi:hypothetical protein
VSANGIQKIIENSNADTTSALCHVRNHFPFLNKCEKNLVKSPYIKKMVLNIYGVYPGLRIMPFNTGNSITTTPSTYGK